MTVSRLYATEKNLGVKNLSAKMGTDRIYYRTKHVHKTIQDCHDGIAYIPLIFNVERDFLHEVTFPFALDVNIDNRLINNSIKGLVESDYVKINKGEPKACEQDYYVNSVFLHKQFLKEGKLDGTVEISNEEYRVRSLGFDEMIKNGSFNFFTAAELLLQPLTIDKLMQTTSYRENTIKKSLTALRYCDLLENRFSEGKHRYSLRSDMEKISKLFEIGRKKKMDRISRMKKYVEVINLHNSRIDIEEISNKTNLKYCSIYPWLFLGKKPKINDKIAQTLSSEGLLLKEEIETFREYGLIEQSALTY